MEELGRSTAVECRKVLIAILLNHWSDWLNFKNRPYLQCISLQFTHSSLSTWNIFIFKLKKNSMWGTSCNGELALHFQFPLFTLLPDLLASILNFGQHRGPTYSYNNGSKKRANWWARFTISIANNKHNTKGHRVTTWQSKVKKFSLPLFWSSIGG